MGLAAFTFPHGLGFCFRDSDSEVLYVSMVVDVRREPKNSQAALGSTTSSCLEMNLKHEFLA